MSTTTATQLLREFHARYAGRSEVVFARGTLADGRSSYQTAADAVPADARRVLDVGCGDGQLLARLHGRERTGLDMSPEELDAARRRLDPGVRLVCGDADALPFSDGAFDAVISHMLLMLMWDARATLAEMTRVLAPGGIHCHVVSLGTVPSELTAVYFGALREQLAAEGMIHRWPSHQAFADPAELLPGFDVHTRDLRLTMRVPWQEIGEFLRVQYYPHGMLPRDAQERIEARVVREATSAEPVEWAFDLRMFTARREQR